MFYSKIPLGSVVDVGCGSGQFTRSLAKHFDDVIGVDISEAQISSARRLQHLNTTYVNAFYKALIAKIKRLKLIFSRVGSGEAIPVPAESTALVTCATAAHYLDPNKFGSEIQRVLKPNGCVAIVCYELVSCRYNGEKVEELEQAFEEVFMDKTTPYMDSFYHLVRTKYADLELPFENIERDDSYTIEKDMMLSDFIGFLKSTALYQLFINANPTKPDPAIQFQQRAREILDVITPVHLLPVTMHFPVFLILARKTVSK
ncbi:putative methyltransferase DDB_G0268948 [Antedon mediterranea]|uniref:putative methyltransferase DDB_G0268948 n=1 Tax=Antedon mediterranea TaxID=105859 RepID=UPI003AF4BDA4